VNRFRYSLLTAALALSVAAPSALALGEQPTSPALGTPPTVYSPDGVIVQWAPGADRADRVEAREDADVDFQSDLGNREFQLVKTESGQTPAEAVAELEANPAVVLAERDGYNATDAIPNDPLFNQLWGLNNLGLGISGFSGAIAGDDISAIPAWDRTVGSPSVVIADIDSGYRFNHPDLAPVTWTNPGEIAGNGIDDDVNGFTDDVHGWDFVGVNGDAPVADNDPTDDDLISGGHGVHTAGTLGAAGNNGLGITGVSRNARIMPLRICTRFPSVAGSRCPFSAEVAAINYAGDMGARVANMSFGGTGKEVAVANAMAQHPNTLYVISAGNDGTNNEITHHYPCDFNPAVDALPPVPGAIDNVICVAATNQADGLASFSDYGVVSVDLGAPGTETLSAYSGQDVPLSLNFEANDFTSQWTVEGAGFGRAGVGDGPLTSFGITDSPGVAPVASTLYKVKQTAGVALPAGTGACTIRGSRYRKGGSFSYGLLVSSAAPQTFVSGETAGSSMASFNTVPITGLGGHTVQFFFEYTADSSPSVAEGVWLDDLRLTCFAPLNSATVTYEFLQGTSMATPHVTGAAGLLFSLKPSATVTEVKNAILTSGDPVASLSGKTTTGRRLDVAAALNSLVPVGTETVAPDTVILSGPEGTVTSTVANFTFSRTDADSGAFECKLDAAAFAPCTSPAAFTVGLGPHQIQVRAKVPSGIVDPTPAAHTWTVSSPSPLPGGGGSGGGGGSSGGPDGGGCTVPALAGKTLGQAKAALDAANCTLGKVTKPKAKKGKKLPALVVKSSTPAAGASPANGKVDLKLGKKPKPKKKHH
jgi:thermitase